MATLSLEQVTKVFPNGVQAVHEFDLFVDEEEFVVLVGRSGCGKTTVLRTVAGLEDVTFGPDVLVAPVTVQGARERDLYLPEGASWLDAPTGEPVEKNGWVTAAAPERIPVYLREGGGLQELSRSGREPPGAAT